MRRWGTLLLVVAVPLSLASCGDDGGDNTSLTDLLTTTPATTTTSAVDTRQRVFDQAALEGENGVKKVLVQDYQLENIESVSCPADQEVKRGNEFTCTVKQGGEEPKEMTVQITVTNDEGQYEVALPEESK